MRFAIERLGLIGNISLLLIIRPSSGFGPNPRQNSHHSPPIEVDSNRKFRKLPTNRTHPVNPNHDRNSPPVNSLPGRWRWFAYDYGLLLIFESISATTTPSRVGGGFGRLN